MASRDQFSTNIRASKSIEQRQNETIIGNIVVNGGTYLIENINLDLTGGISASNNATVIIRNAMLFTTANASIVLADQARFVAEDASIVVDSSSRGYPSGTIYTSEMILGDETTVNITDSELYGRLYIICRQNSRIYVSRSTLEGPTPADYGSCGVLTEDNATARIQDSELDTAQAGGNSSIYIDNSHITTEGVSASENGLIEIENSVVGTAQWFSDNSTLRIIDSTVDVIDFEGSSLIVRGSQVPYRLWVRGNSTAWLTNVSASSVAAEHNAVVWLINSYSGAIYTEDQGRVNVGWQLPIFGILAVPHNWIPILQGIAVLTSIGLIIALLVALNRRWKRRQQWKMKERALLSDRS